MPHIALVRRVYFSSGHRYWSAGLGPDENRARFGPWASPYNHGHNYVLDVAISGSIDPSHGMVINIKTLDDILQERIVRDFDQKSLNDEVAEFQSRPPTTENLLLVIADRLRDLPPGVRLDRLDLQENHLLSASYNLTMNALALTRTYEFAASHRLHAPSLGEQANLELFGKCNNPNGHGHNYVLEVSVEANPDPDTGMMIDLGTLDRIVNREVVDRYDHKNLSLDLPEFANKNATSEVVALEIFERLRAALPLKLAKVRLLETARNAFEITAD